MRRTWILLIIMILFSFIDVAGALRRCGVDGYSGRACGGREEAGDEAVRLRGVRPGLIWAHISRKDGEGGREMKWIWRYEATLRFPFSLIK